MAFFKEIARRLAWLRRRSQFEQELSEEFKFHIETRADELVRGGLTRSEALTQARREFGCQALACEDTRSAWAFAPLEDFVGDVRYGARSLAKSPGFTAVVIATLALGIGANTTIFSVVAALQFRPLPFRDPQQLVIVCETQLKNPQWRGRNLPLSTALHVREHNTSFEAVELATSYNEPGRIRIGERMEQVRVQHVSPDLLTFLGITPMLGRSFRPEDVSFSDGNAILLSHAFWKERFGGDPHVVGRTITDSDHSSTIIGVLPPKRNVFPSGKAAGVLTAINLTHDALTPDSRWFTVIARLKPGVSLQQAQGEMEALGTNLARDHAEANRDWKVAVHPMHEYFFRSLRKEMYLLLGAVCFVLLIACANVANLLLVRGATRRKEIALRASLGASRLRLVRQLLTESLLLGVLGGTASVAMAFLGIRIFAALAPAWVTGWQEIRIDGTALAFALVVGVFTGSLFGLVPSIKAASPNPNDVLKEAGSRSGGAPRQFGRNGLVISEIALTLILLAGAGLMVNSFLRLRSVDLGFNVDNLLTAGIQLQGSKYRELLMNDIKRVKPAADAFYEQVSERAARAPEVRAVATQGGDYECTFQIIGEPDRANRSALFSEVSFDFLRALQVPLLRGRMLNERDNERSPWVAVINNAMAHRYFSEGKSPIGKMVSVTLSGVGAGNLTEDQPRRIVGVIGNLRALGPDEPPAPEIYVPDRQHMRAYPGGLATTHLWRTVYVRTASNPLRMADKLRAIVAEVDGDETVTDIATMEEAASRCLAPSRFYMRLFGIFSALAACLSIVGIYGVISYSVTLRTHEFGLRLALGAAQHNVLLEVIGKGLKLTVAGITLGVAGAFGLTRMIAHLLYGVSPGDPLTFAAVAAILSFASLAACYIPALRATRVDPLIALRHE